LDFNELTRLSAREDFINFSRRESFTSYTSTRLHGAVFQKVVIFKFYENCQVVQMLFGGIDRNTCNIIFFQN
jgi:hypothetical protein